MSGGGFRSAVRFSGTRTEIAEATLLASVGYRVAPALSVELGLGAVLDGSLEPDGAGEVDLMPGPAISASLSWLALYETAHRPFVFAALSLSAVTVPTAGARLTALDARASLLAGKTFFDRLVVYAGARVFGGPVWWELAGDDVVGGDVHHYSAGLGARLSLPGGVDLFVEGMGVGEQSVNAGAGVAF